MPLGYSPSASTVAPKNVAIPACAHAFRLATVAALGGFLFGYDISIISGAIIFLEREFQMTEWQKGFAVSSAAIGCIFGPLVAVALSDCLGRKKTLVIASLLLVLSALATALPRNLTEFYLGRLVGGVGVGLASIICPMYIAEMAPPQFRGRLVSVNQIAIVTGLFLAVVISYVLSFGEHWRWMFASGLVPALGWLGTLTILPESPRWLVVKGREAEALDFLARTEGKEQAGRALAEIKASIAKLRRHMLRMAAGKGQGYIGQGLGFADILAALYFHEMIYDPTNPGWEDRDRFILSTGHYSIGLWAALAETGILPLAELSQYGADESRLEMSTLDSTPGVEMTGGSLGHGLGQGVGMALGLRLKGKASRVFVELSDGELQEGSTWEAAMCGAHFRLDQLIAIVDCNGIQADGPLVLNIEPVAEKWRSFGWEAVEIDGNKMHEVVAAFENARQPVGRPKVIIARTLPGKGVPAIERCEKAHFLNVTHVNWNEAIQELEAQYE